MPNRQADMRGEVGRLRLATLIDLTEVMAIESTPAYEDQVGRWSEERHQREMSLSSSRYFVLESASGSIDGFAIVQGIGSVDRRAHLKRIAVREAGRGIGSILLLQLLEWLFRETETHRVDLDVFEANDRARRAYEKAGFKAEGLLRDYHRRPDGDFASMWMMSILRPEWESSG